MAANTTPVVFMTRKCWLLSLNHLSSQFHTTVVKTSTDIDWTAQTSETITGLTWCSPELSVYNGQLSWTLFSTRASATQWMTPTSGYRRWGWDEINTLGRGCRLNCSKSIQRRPSPAGYRCPSQAHFLCVHPASAACLYLTQLCRSGGRERGETRMTRVRPRPVVRRTVPVSLLRLAVEPADMFCSLHWPFEAHVMVTLRSVQGHTGRAHLFLISGTRTLRTDKSHINGNYEALRSVDSARVTTKYRSETVNEYKCSKQCCSQDWDKQDQDCPRLKFKTKTIGY